MKTSFLPSLFPLLFPFLIPSTLLCLLFPSSFSPYLLSVSSSPPYLLSTFSFLFFLSLPPLCLLFPLLSLSSFLYLLLYLLFLLPPPVSPVAVGSFKQ